jgi:hypothetical protein
MACPFCGTALTIPFELRWEQQAITPEPPPPAGKPVFDPFKAVKDTHPDTQQPEKKVDTEFVTKALRQAQPLAAGAVSAYALWASIRRILPGCLIALSILCVLSCGISAAVIYMLRQGG